MHGGIGLVGCEVCCVDDVCGKTGDMVTSGAINRAPTQRAMNCIMGCGMLYPSRSLNRAWDFACFAINDV